MTMQIKILDRVCYGPTDSIVTNHIITYFFSLFFLYVVVFHVWDVHIAYQQYCREQNMYLIYQCKTSLLLTLKTNA